LHLSGKPTLINLSLGGLVPPRETFLGK